jgi:hypothetical protein
MICGDTGNCPEESQRHAGPVNGNGGKEDKNAEYQAFGVRERHHSARLTPSRPHMARYSIAAEPLSLLLPGEIDFGEVMQ